jgi:hypothetical protein
MVVTICPENPFHFHIKQHFNNPATQMRKQQNVIGDGDDYDGGGDKKIVPVLF